MGEVVMACAMSREAAALEKQIGRSVLATGVGISRSVPTILQRLRGSKPEVLIFTGSAGQLDLSLEMGDVVFPAGWSLETGPLIESDATLLNRLRGRWTIEGRGITLGRPVVKAKQRSELFESTEARIYDSVTAAVLRVARSEGVPCLTPKIVASTVNSGLMGFWQRLDRNIQPLADQLIRLLHDLGEGRG